MMPIADSRRDLDTQADQTHHGLRVIPTRPAPAADADNGSGLDPRRIINGLKYHWLLVAVFGSLLGAGIGAAAWTLLPGKYTTYAVLHMASKSNETMFERNEDGRSEFITFIKSQASIIKSEVVLKPALNHSKIGNTEMLRQHDDPVRWLEENLLVEFSENSEYFKVSLTGENPQELADIINAIVDAYMREVVQKDKANSNDRLTQLESIEKSLRDSVKNMQDLVRKEHTDKAKPGDTAAPPLPGGSVVAIPDAAKLPVGPNEFARMTDNLRRAEVEYTVAAGRVKQLDAQIKRLETAEVSNDDLEAALKRDQDYQIFLDKAARAEKKQKYLEEITIDPANNADYQAAIKSAAKAKADAEDYKRKVKGDLNRMAVAQLRNQMTAQREKVQETVDRAKIDVDSLKFQLAAAIVIKESTPGKLATDINLTPNDTTLDQMEKVFELLLRRINLLKIAIQTPSRVNVIQKASVPIKKEMKKQILGTGFGGILGFAIVGGLITLYEGRVRRVFGSRELTANPAVNMIGLLPDNGSEGPFMEAVDQVRIMLARNFLGKRAQTILITSAEAGEGKTTLAGHLAISMTKTDKKTIIVDCDLRDPGLHLALERPLQPGVCEVLRGQNGLTEVVQRTAVNNLWFLSAGTYDPDAQQAIGRDKFRRVVEKLRQEFDTIIIDSHAVLPVADTLLVGQHCDAVVLCARRHVSRKHLVDEAYQRVSELGVPHCGMIFMGESPR